MAGESAAGSAESVISADRQSKLARIVLQDCGSCHGMTLRGGLGPPLTPRALGEHSTESLALVILGGRPGTPMPPWRKLLSESEADWIAGRLKAGAFSAR